jgi:hypothetical protein
MDYINSIMSPGHTTIAKRDSARVRLGYSRPGQTWDRFRHWSSWFALLACTLFSKVFAPAPGRRSISRALKSASFAVILLGYLLLCSCSYLTLFFSFLCVPKSGIKSIRWETFQPADFQLALKEACIEWSTHIQWNKSQHRTILLLEPQIWRRWCSSYSTVAFQGRKRKKEDEGCYFILYADQEEQELQLRQTGPRFIQGKT